MKGIFIRKQFCCFRFRWPLNEKNSLLVPTFETIRNFQRLQRVARQPEKTASCSRVECINLIDNFDGLKFYELALCRAFGRQTGEQSVRAPPLMVRQQRCVEPVSGVDEAGAVDFG